MKKALSIIKTVLVWLVVIVAVFMMIFTIVSVRTFDRNDRDIFGYKMFIVQTDSMSATHFSAGDLVIVKEVDPVTLKAGDVITYTSQNSHNYGETVTHMIRKKTIDANGDYGFITYGTTTGVDDETVVTFPYIEGKYVLYFSMSTWGGEWDCGIGRAVSDSPTGPFKDAKLLFQSKHIGVQNSI
ncbi:MAG: hypothetical protein J6Q76_06075, partial [Clostridia bacterium]|nr:hypothetical protein [Clostridia bacterium]